MNGSELLAALEAAGAEFDLLDGDIRVTVASKALTPEMRQALQDKGPLRAAYLEREWLRYLATRPLPTDDPRPDLAEDSERWTALLNLANAQDTALRQTLHGFRCLGARLVTDADGLRLVPHGTPAGVAGEMEPAEYARYREERLLPRAAEVAGLLATLGARLARHARSKIPKGQREGVAEAAS